MKNVTITFFPYDEECAIVTESAEVVVRHDGDVMVIDVAGAAGRSKYLLTGRRSGHVYAAGLNEAPGSLQRVSAQWARVGDSIIGKWIENSREYLFEFSMPDDDD
jgi:hypothetical protein